MDNAWCMPPIAGLSSPRRMKTTARLNHSSLFGKNSHPARIGTEEDLRRGPTVFLGELDDAMTMSPNPRKWPPTNAGTKRRPAAAHLLVLECHEQKLAGQALNFGSKTVPFLKALFPTKCIVLVPTSSLSELGPSLAEASAKYGRFRSVVVVGHSNAMGLQLTNDHFCSWQAVGQWVTKFEPEFLFLAACEAGRSEAVRSLFAPIPSLQEVYASPIHFYAGQSAPLVGLIALALKDRKIDSDASSFMRTLNYAITGGQIFRWRRGEVGKGEALSAKLWDSLPGMLNRLRGQ